MSGRGPRQRDIVQIAESGDIDHRGAAAAEPSGTDTSDLTVVLSIPPAPQPSRSLATTTSWLSRPRSRFRCLSSPPSRGKTSDSFPPGCYILKIGFLAIWTLPWYPGEPVSHALLILHPNDATLRVDFDNRVLYFLKMKDTHLTVDIFSGLGSLDNLNLYFRYRTYIYVHIAHMYVLC